MTDAGVGNLQNAIAFSRARTIFNHNGKAVKGVLTIAAVDQQIEENLARLLSDDVQDVLLNGQCEQIVAALSGQQVALKADTCASSVIGTFTIRNEHGYIEGQTPWLVMKVKKLNRELRFKTLREVVKRLMLRA